MTVASRLCCGGQTLLNLDFSFIFPEGKAKREGSDICMMSLHDAKQPDLWICARYIAQQGVALR